MADILFPAGGYGNDAADGKDALLPRSGYYQSTQAGGVIINRSIQDNEGHSDSVNRIVDYFRAISDNEGYSDSVNRIVDYFRAISDNEGHSDSVNRIVNYLRSVVDN